MQLAAASATRLARTLGIERSRKKSWEGLIGSVHTSAAAIYLAPTRDKSEN